MNHFPRTVPLFFAFYSLLCLTLPAFGQTKASDSNAADAPWLGIGIEQRTRYEMLDHRFRLGETGSDQQLPQRTRLRIEIGKVIAPFGLVAEFQDSRIHLDDSGSTVNNSMVDENDFTQLYLSFAMKPRGKTGLPGIIYAGRQSFDLGSRRLFARNRFRNTTNAFDAVRWTLGDERHWQLTTFLSRPVARRMDQPDRPDHTAAFWGAFLAASFSPRFRNEFYYFGLRESLSAASSKRRYSTVGTRFYKEPSRGVLSYELEAALQFGKRGTLNHLAHFEHISAEYTAKIPWSPLLRGRYDYASGTRNPASQHDGTFDTLYGARRWEYGPTGIYGVIYRSNINSPGWDLEFKPSKRLFFSTAMRWIWLASARDQWVGTRLKDPTGNSGSYIGSQIELRVGYPFKNYFRPEIGYVRFMKGSYLEKVPNSPGAQDSNYFYVETSFAVSHFWK